MRKLLLTAAVLAACLPLSVAGQGSSDQLKDFTRTLQTEGLQLSLVHLNDKTVPVLFQPPNLYVIRAHAKQATMLYVQGTPQKDVQLDTSTFSIQQGSEEAVPAKPVNIKNFATGKVAKGERIDGVLEFAKLVDVSKPFNVKHGKDSVEFKFSADQVKAMSAPAAAPQPQ